MSADKIDWLQFEIKDDANNQSYIAPMPNNQQPTTDWSQYQVNEQGNQGEEDEGFSIPEATGISGVFSDLLSGALGAKNFVQDIPNKMEKYQKHEEEHPVGSVFHGTGQVAAEGADIAKGIINSPYNLNQYLARKHLLPQVLGKIGKLIPHIPENTGLENVLGLEPDAEKGDDLLRGIVKATSMAPIASSATKQLGRAFKGPDMKTVVKETQKKVNAATQDAGKVFDKIENKLDNTGKNIVPVDAALIDQAKSMLSRQFDGIVKQAKTGDYKALRKLQSALGAKERKGLASKNLGDVDAAQNIGVVRNDINASIENHLKDVGFDDLAKELKQTKAAYKDIKDTYFSTPALARVFGKSQKVPKDPLTLLTEDSTEMKRFMSAHPEVKKAMSAALKAKGRKKKAAIVAGVVGSGISGGTTYKVLNKH